jgi:hypothetical protein
MYVHILNVDVLLSAFFQPVTTTILGYALLVINSIVALILLVLTVLKLGAFFLHLHKIKW